MRMKKNVYVIKEGKSKVLNKWSKADGFCKKKKITQKEIWKTKQMHNYVKKEQEGRREI